MVYFEVWTRDWLPLPLSTMWKHNIDKKASSFYFPPLILTNIICLMEQLIVMKYLTLLYVVQPSKLIWITDVRFYQASHLLSLKKTPCKIVTALLHQLTLNPVELGTLANSESIFCFLCLAVLLFNHLSCDVLLLDAPCLHQAKHGNAVCVQKV